MSSKVNNSKLRRREPAFRQQILTVDALCGSGKSYQAMRVAVEEASKDQRVCVLQPTIDLLEQNYRDAQALFQATSVTITPIHCKDSNSNWVVSSRIMDYLKRPAPNGGDILLITHAAFLSLPYFHREQDWILICDEVPEVCYLYEENLRDTHFLITDAVDVKVANTQYLEMIEPQVSGDNDGSETNPIKDAYAPLRTIAENKYNDSGWKLVQDLAWSICSPHHNAYITQELWDTLNVRRKRLDGKAVKLSAHVTLRPSVFSKFKQVIILGALFEKTLLYRLWKHFVEFVPYERIESKLRFYGRHDNKGAIHIKYFTEGSWSKYGYTQQLDGKPIVDYYTDAIRNVLGKEQFLYSINKHSVDPFLGLKGIQLPGTPHGINTYQHIDHVAFVASYNPPPHSFTFYKAKGIDSEEVNEGIMLQAVYQAIMRSSLRDPNCKNEHIVIVPTLALAEALSRLFSNCTVDQLVGVPTITLNRRGRPKSPNAISGAKRQSNYLRKKMIRKVLSLNGFLEV